MGMPLRRERMGQDEHIRQTGVHHVTELDRGLEECFKVLVGSPFRLSGLSGL